MSAPHDVWHDFARWPHASKHPIIDRWVVWIGFRRSYDRRILLVADQRK